MPNAWLRPAYAPDYAAPEPPEHIDECQTCGYWTRDRHPKATWGTCHERVLRGSLTHQWHGCCEHTPREEEVAS